MVEQDSLVTAASGERIGILLKELMSIVVQRSSGEMLAVMNEAGLSLPQMVTLQKLERSGAHSISAIAEALNLSLAATSHLVDRMVNHGLVVRSEDANDRRHKSVVISPAGKVLLDRLVAARVHDIDQAIAVLPSELRSDLQFALTHIVDTLRDAPLPQPKRARSEGQSRKKSSTAADEPDS